MIMYHVCIDDVEVPVRIRDPNRVSSEHTLTELLPSFRPPVLLGKGKESCII